MGYNHFRYARRVDGDNLGIYHNDMTKLLNLDKGTANTIIVTGLTGSSKVLRLKAGTGNAYPYIDLTGGAHIDIVTGGLVRMGTGNYHIFDMNGVHFFNETSTPTAITNYGAIYTKNDNKLYFQDGAGTEHTVAFV
jgi:hypothetical protein